MLWFRMGSVYENKIEKGGLFLNGFLKNVCVSNFILPLSKHENANSLNYLPSSQEFISVPDDQK